VTGNDASEADAVSAGGLHGSEDDVHDAVWVRVCRDVRRVHLGDAGIGTLRQEQVYRHRPRGPLRRITPTPADRSAASGICRDPVGKGAVLILTTTTVENVDRFREVLGADRAP
jgi:hypothetical protein